MSPMAVNERTSSPPMLPISGRAAVDADADLGQSACAAATASMAWHTASAGARRRARVVRLPDRCVEQHHQRVADEVRDRSALGEQQRNCEPEVVVQHLHDFGGLARSEKAVKPWRSANRTVTSPLFAAECRLGRVGEQRGGDVR